MPKAHASPFLKYQKEILLLEDYFNKARTFKASFTQFSYDEIQSTGFLYIIRPGMIKLEYTEPNKIEIIVKENKVTYFDKELDEVSYSKLETFLPGILAEERILLLQKNILTKIVKKQNTIEFYIYDPKFPDQGELSLVFDNNISKLISINMIDIDKQVTTILLENIQTNIQIDKNIFVVKRKIFR